LREQRLAEHRATQRDACSESAQAGREGP